MGASTTTESLERNHLRQGHLAGRQAEKTRVSIGLAVYNGERYLREALDSLLAQTYTDFELVVSDNASTDETQRICQEYAEKDPRIRYFRNETNIGGANNENRTFQLSRGEYFRWAAHDDICHPEMLSKCVEVLEKDPSVVLVFPIVVDIDEAGRHMNSNIRDLARSENPVERFRNMTNLAHNCEETYGLIRSETLHKTKLQQNYTDSDRTLLAELSLHGRFLQILEPLFFRRIHPNKSTVVFSNWRDRMYWFDSANRNRIQCPHWMQFVDYLRVIARVPIGFSDRIKCYMYMFTWLAQGHGRWMVKDLLVAVQRAMRMVVFNASHPRQSSTTESN